VVGAAGDVVDADEDGVPDAGAVVAGAFVARLTLGSGATVASLDWVAAPPHPAVAMAKVAQKLKPSNAGLRIQKVIMSIFLLRQVVSY
jgi:hypothetical protein